MTVEKEPAPVDPTKNVLDLVAAQEKQRDALRATDLEHAKELREAEARRLNDLAAQKLIDKGQMLVVVSVLIAMAGLVFAVVMAMRGSHN